jgi:N-acetyl-gamma-glutamyl-phosphate reductase
MGPRVGIVGYRGYSGAELVRILERHARVEPVLLEHRQGAAADADSQAIRNWKGPLCLPCTAEAVRAERIALVFLATPPEVSMDLAPAMLGAGTRGGPERGLPPPHA